MGKIATRKSTLAIITTDNPRTENPQDIIKEIEAGVEPQNFSKYTSIPDRREAIKMAIKNSLNQRYCSRCRKRSRNVSGNQWSYRHHFLMKKIKKRL